MVTITITNASKILKGREAIKLKDTTNAVKLDEATQSGKVIFAPADWAVLKVDTEDGESYEKYVILDKDGVKYTTGSQSFWSSFIDIWNDMSGEDEDYQVEVYRVDSKNYKGKQFLSCSII